MKDLKPIPMRPLLTLWLALVPWLPIGLSAQDFSAFVDKKQVQVGETFQVSFRLSNVQGKTPQFPDFDGFNVRGGPGLSQSTTIVNRQVSQSVTYSFYLQAMSEGSFTIGAATVEAGGQTLRSEPIEVTVSARGSSPAPGNQGGQQAGRNDGPSVEDQLKDNVFVRTLVDKTDVYQGEQVTVTYKFYKRVQTMNLTAEDPPRYEGFWVEGVDLPRVTSQQEVYQGRQYQTAVIKQDILFPQRSGELTLDPMTLSCVVQVRTQPANPRNPFERFFNTYQEYNYSFKSPAVRLQVKPLPTAGRPAGFSGMVGTFDLETSLDRTETETGEPITLKVTLSGQGNIKKMPPLDLDFPEDFDVFDPQVSEQTSRQGGRLGGRRSYEYLIVPRNPGDYRLPEIRFSYFDVRKGRYETLTGPEYVINVTGEPQLAPAPLPGNIGQDEVELIGQ
ncbi:MAG: protein BatD, partial [Bacteroidetes bacterium]